MFCIDGGEYFHRQPSDADDPLDTGSGLVARAESKAVQSNPGGRCPQGDPTPGLRSLTKLNAVWGARSARCSRTQCGRFGLLGLSPAVWELSDKCHWRHVPLYRWPQPGWGIWALGSRRSSWPFSIPHLPPPPCFLNYVCALTQEKGKSSLLNLLTIYLHFAVRGLGCGGGSLSRALSLTTRVGYVQMSKVSRLPTRARTGWRQSRVS